MLATSVFRGSAYSWNRSIGRLIGGLLGAPEGGSGRRLELHDVGRLAGGFSGGPGGTLSGPGDDGLVLESAAGVTFDTHHNHIGGGFILAKLAYNLDILALPWWRVANCVSC